MLKSYLLLKEKGHALPLGKKKPKGLRTGASLIRPLCNILFQGALQVSARARGPALSKALTVSALRCLQLDTPGGARPAAGQWGVTWCQPRAPVCLL